MKSKKPPRKELDKLYWEEGHSPSQIARAYDVHPSTVREWLIEKNIRLKTISEAKMQKGVKKPPKRELQRLYHTENLSTRNIGERYDVSYKTVSKWLKIDGIKIKTKSEASLPNGVKKPTERELKRCIDDEMPLTDIARNYGVHPKTVATWMDSMEIKRKRIKRNTKDGEWKDLEYALEQANLFLADHLEYSDLPSRGVLSENGASSLSGAITKYHGGFVAFRQRLAEYRGDIVEQRSLLERYAEGKYG